MARPPVIIAQSRHPGHRIFLKAPDKGKCG